MLFHQQPKVAGAGNNYITFQLPVGAILKKINALNSTKYWQATTLMLTESKAGTGRNLSLEHRVPQAGNRDVTWEGELTIDSPFVFVTVLFTGCDAADALTLTVGYEMLAPRRRWW